MARHASAAPARTSVPLAACEPAERDQTDQQDDQADPEAPHDHQHDPDDHEDAAEADAADAPARPSVSHICSLRGVKGRYPTIWAVKRTMRSSTGEGNDVGHILTSHAGSLPRPDDLIELNRRRLEGEPYDEGEYQERLREATIEVVRRQAEIGIDIPNDGEYGHTMGARVDYGAWWSYAFQRLGGLGLWTD